MDEQSDQPVPGQMPMFEEHQAPVEPWGAPIMPTEDFAPLAEAAEPDHLVASEMGFEIRIAPSLQGLAHPLTDFEPHPRNFRKHNLEAIAQSLRKFGQQSPIVVQKSTGYVCKGNGTYKALIGLGATEVAASIVEMDDDTAYRYLLADNRASDLARYERDALAEALTTLAEGPGLQDTLWSAEDVDDLRAEVGSITIIEPPDFRGGYSENPEDRAKREQQSVQPADKMREVPIVMTLGDHQRFMANIGILKKAYGTSGTIATVVEAVRREAVLSAPSSGVPTAAEPEPEGSTPEPEAPVTALPEGEGEGGTEAEVGPSEEDLLDRLGLGI